MRKGFVGFGVAAATAVALGAMAARGGGSAGGEAAAAKSVPVAIRIEARGWDMEGTPALVHVTASEADGGAEAFEAYHAITAAEAADGEADVALPAGGAYELEFTSPVTARGRIYETQSVTWEEGTSEDGGHAAGDSAPEPGVEASFDPIPKADVTQSDLDAIARAWEEAIGSDAADETLSGEAGERAVEQVREATGAGAAKTGEGASDAVQKRGPDSTSGKSDGTAKTGADGSADPQGDSDTVSGKAVSASGAKGGETPNPPPTGGTAPSTGSTTSGSAANADSGKAEATTPAKERTWVEEQGHWEDVYEDRPTYEQVWVQDSGAWDEPIYESYGASICNTCGEEVSGFANQHLLDTEHGGWHTEVRTRQVGTNHHDATGHWEQVQAGTERVKVGRSWVVDVPGHWE